MNARDIRTAALVCLALLVVAILLSVPWQRPELVATITPEMQESGAVGALRFEEGWNYWIVVRRDGTAEWWRARR
jgi:hypothetical protein